MKLRTARTIGVTFVFVIVFAHTVLAAVHPYYGYKLVNGITNRKFAFASGSGLMSETREAVTNWNDSPTRFYFYEGSSPAIMFFNFNYGNTGWNGATYFRNSSGGYIDPETQNWYSNDILMNTSKTRTSAEWVRTAAHELGHAIGLDHCTDQYDLMYPTPNNVQRPQDDDIDTTNFLYP